MITVKFSKLFTAGILSGLTHEGTLTFPNRQSAQSWIDGVTGRTIKEGSGASIYTSAVIL